MLGSATLARAGCRRRSPNGSRSFRGIPDVRLHAVGRLQSNKAAEAVRLFDVIHSLDRRSLLDALRSAAEKAGRFPAVYIQVNIGEEEQKGGCPIGEVGDLVAAVRASPLPLAGLMASRRLGSSRHLSSRFSLSLAGVMTSWPEHGHVGRLQAAVMLGATAVRVGTALFEDDA